MAIVQNRFTELLARKCRVENRSISREQIASETGISLSSVQNWAQNKIKRFDGKQIVTFCRYLNCTIDDLLIIVPEPGDESPEMETPLAEIA